MNLNKKLAIIDIGNSSVKIKILNNFYVFGYDNDLEKNITDLFDLQEVRNVIFSSVNTKQVEKISSIFIKKNINVQNISEILNNQKIIDFSEISGMGNDRKLGLIGATLYAKPPLITVDCGTAITVNALNENYKSLGGAILLGIETQSKALHHFTSLLPQVEITESNIFTNNFIGSNTIDAITAGVLASTTGGIITVIKNIFAHNLLNCKDKNVNIFFTGGYGEVLYAACLALLSDYKSNLIIHYKENLVLTGMEKLQANDCDFHYLCSLNASKYKAVSIDEAFNFCKKIAENHYENFPVGSILIHKYLRKYFYAIYAFARIADDIADEYSKKFTKSETLKLLYEYENCLQQIYSQNENSEFSNPIFVALKDTVNKFQIPISPFQKLLTAFKSDVNFKQPNDFSDLFAYCENSANPIGELLLRLFDEYNETNLHYSNCICTSLQLINFWQDLSVDLRNGRCYIPKSIIKKHFDFETFCAFEINEKFIANYEKQINDIVQQIHSQAKNLMDEGKNLLRYINNFRFKLELKAIIFGGEILLRKIKKMETKIFLKRPKIL